MAKDGGNAFPCVFKLDQGSKGIDGKVLEAPEQHVMTGMTLRDYFAAKAMQAQIVSGKWNVMQAVNVSGWSYQFADAMLAEREKGGKA